MKKIFKNLTITTLLLATVMGGGCKREDSRLPQLKENQHIVVHQNNSELNYTLLTDVDYDGSWDCAEDIQIGSTPGSYSQKFFVKEGFIPANSPYDITIVEESFFEKYK